MSIIINEKDNTIYGSRSTDNNNIVFIPGNAITGPDTPTLLTSYNAFVKNFGDHGVEDSITWEYVSEILNAGFPVLFYRIDKSNMNSQSPIVLTKKSHLYVDNEGHSTDISNATVGFSAKYGGTFGNSLYLSLTEEYNNVYLRVYYNNSLRQTYRVTTFTSSTTKEEKDKLVWEGLKNLESDYVDVITSFSDSNDVSYVFTPVENPTEDSFAEASPTYDSYNTVTPTPVYSIATGDEAVFSVIDSPSGNPYSQGWYIRTGEEGSYVYTLCPDTETEVDSEKTYCTKDSGSDPSQEGWYVQSGTDYVLSTDTYMVPGTSYFVKSYQESPVAEGWYVQSGSSWELSDDVTVDPEKTYYSKTAGSNPSGEGWYEYNESTSAYSLSVDTSADSSKTYYIRTAGDNPSANGWYEWSEASSAYIESTDISVDPSKTYYIRTERDPYEFVEFNLLLMSGGTDVTDEEIAEELSRDFNLSIFSEFSDKYIYDIKFICSGGIIDSELKVANNMRILAERRGDALAILDMPMGIDKGTANQYFNTIDSSYATAFAPWVYTQLKVSRTKAWMPPSLEFLRNLANSVITNNNPLWYPVVGIKRASLKNVSNTEYDVSGSMLEEWQELNNQSLNPIMKIRSYGYIIYGQRTLYSSDESFYPSPSALRQLSVRITANEIKKAIFNLCIGLKFEKNDEVTWTEFKDGLEPLLKAMKLDRGITDYQLEMNSNLITDDDIQEYRIRGIVRISVLNSAENFEIDFILEPSNVTFEENVL